MTSTEVANMTTKYLQQGKTLSDALTLTEAAAKAARIAGISGSESIDLLTNAMNGFQVSASKAMEVSDKFAALAASAATDYEELATALSKVAAQANLAGMSMDFTLGMLTKGIEVTREAPETIGTALKTVIARMRELTDYGKTLDDSMDVNRVAKALDNIGVALMDENNEFRNLDDVLTEVGMKWDTLNKNQQANVAVALAGTRQQSRLIAMLQDFDRTQQLVNISMNSAGATAAQHRKYMQGLEAAVTKLTTSYQKLITTFTNSDFAITAINKLSSGLEMLSENIGLVKVGAAALIGLGISQNIEKISEKTFGLVANMAARLSLTQKTIDQNKIAVQQEAEYQLAIVNRQIAEQEAIIKTAKSMTEQEFADAKRTLAEKENTIATNENTKAQREQEIANLQNKKSVNELTIAKLKQKSVDAKDGSEEQAKINAEIQNLISESRNIKKDIKQKQEETKTLTDKINEQKQEVQKIKDVEIAKQKESAAANELESLSKAKLLLEDQKLTGSRVKSIGLRIKEAAIDKLVSLGLTREIAQKKVLEITTALHTIFLTKETKAKKQEA